AYSELSKTSSEPAVRWAAMFQDALHGVWLGDPLHAGSPNFCKVRTLESQRDISEPLTLPESLPPPKAAASGLAEDRVQGRPSPPARAEPCAEVYFDVSSKCRLPARTAVWFGGIHRRSRR